MGVGETWPKAKLPVPGRDSAEEGDETRTSAARGLRLRWAAGGAGQRQAPGGEKAPEGASAPAGIPQPFPAEDQRQACAPGVGRPWGSASLGGGSDGTWQSRVQFATRKGLCTAPHMGRLSGLSYKRGLHAESQPRFYGYLFSTDSNCRSLLTAP